MTLREMCFVILITLVLSFGVGQCLGDRTPPKAPPADQVEVDKLKKDLAELQKQIKELRRIVGLEGPDARPEGLQHKLSRGKKK